MFNFLLGLITMLGLVLLLRYVGEKKLEINWWQWLLTGLGFLLAVITISSIYTLFVENEAGAAQFVALVFGLLTVVWGVLLGRFVFNKA